MDIFLHISHLTPSFFVMLLILTIGVNPTASVMSLQIRFFSSLLVFAIKQLTGDECEAIP